MSYMHFAPNGWDGRRTAMDKAGDAMDAYRRSQYGLNWYRLDLWGRSIIKDTPEQSNYAGKRFVEGMARNIAKGVRV